MNFQANVYLIDDDPRCGIGPGRIVATVQAYSEEELKRVLKGMNLRKRIVEAKQINMTREIEIAMG